MIEQTHWMIANEGGAAGRPWFVFRRLLWEEGGRFLSQNVKAVNALGCVRKFGTKYAARRAAKELNAALAVNELELLSEDRANV